MDLTGFGSIADFAKGIMDRFFPKQMTQEEKAKAQLELEALLGEREQKVIESKASIIVAEMQQGDKFTKRARPMVVYSGLTFIGLVHVVFPLAAAAVQIFCSIYGKVNSFVLPELTLPSQFWWAWGSVVSVWELGRTWEKANGSGNKMIDMITGSK